MHVMSVKNDAVSEWQKQESHLIQPKRRQNYFCQPEINLKHSSFIYLLKMQTLSLICNSCADGGVSLVVFTASLENGAWLSLSWVFLLAALAPLLSHLLHAVVAGSALRRHVSWQCTALPKQILAQKPCKEWRTSISLFASVNPPKTSMLIRLWEAG